MSELRYAETNSGDDSSGRAFGLDGNLYLPVTLTALGSLGIFGLLTLVFHVNLAVAALIVVAPFLLVLGWAVLLRHGRPAGYDRDFVFQILGGGSFTRVDAEQGRVA